MVEDAMSNAIKRRLSDPLGVDFEKDVIGKIGDRFTHVSWFEKPARVNSGTNLVGVKLVDAAAFQATLDKMVAKAGAAATKKNHRGITYYQFEPRRQPAERRRDIDPATLAVRWPSSGTICCFPTAPSVWRRPSRAKNDPSKSLADELDFKLIASRIQQHLGSAQPGMIAFQRPEETMRSFYELATSPNTRRRLEEAAQTNPAFRALNEALKANPLPPFSEIAKYLAPGGGMMVSDETGIHYTAFGLKRE